MPCSCATARKNESGFCINIPQPSPVFPSAAIPPRWVMQVRESIAVSNNLWLVSPSIWAIKPKPQLSLKSPGVYRPVLIEQLSSTKKFSKFKGLGAPNAQRMSCVQSKRSSFYTYEARVTNLDGQTG